MIEALTGAFFSVFHHQRFSLFNELKHNVLPVHFHINVSVWKHQKPVCDAILESYGVVKLS